MVTDELVTPRVGTKAHKQRIGERDNWTCGICGWFIIPTLSVYESKWAAVVDHIIPRCAGGTHEDDNLQIAHYECNRLKGVDVGNRSLAQYHADQRQAVKRRLERRQAWNERRPVTQAEWDRWYQD